MTRAEGSRVQKVSPPVRVGDAPRQLEPSRLTQSDVFQRNAGWNFAATPLLPLQTKLEIGAVDDPLEREADAAADRVLRMPGPLASPVTSRWHGVQRKCSACEEEDKEHKLARKQAVGSAVTAVAAPPIVHEVLNGHGQPLAWEEREYFEPRFGQDLSGVRVHTGQKAAESARSIGALAYTVGSNIVFGNNRDNRHSEAGRLLLAHELAHTLQQSRGGAMAHGRIVQRQGDSAVHASPPASVPYEKWSPDVEAMYRRNGLVIAANAIAKCRQGECSKLLTEAEAYQAYRNGRVKAGIKDSAEEPKEKPISTGPLVAGAAPLAAAPLAAPAGEAAASTAAKTAAERAAIRWGMTEAASAAATAPGAVAAPSAAAVGTVAVPVAMGVVLIIAIVDLMGYATFQVALQNLGYVILPNPLQVCISGCHQPAAPKFGNEAPTFPGKSPSPMSPFPMSPADDKALRDWLEPSPTEASRKKQQPTPQVGPQPAPAPQPASPPKSSKCTNEEHDALYREMKRFCDQVRNCDPKTDTCGTATAKVAAFYACLDARVNFQKKCYSKGDPGYVGHMEQIAQLYKRLAECQAVMAKKCM